MTNGLPIALAHVGRDPAELDLQRDDLGRPPVARERFFAAARELFLERPRDEWVELMQRNDVNCQPIEPAELVFDHPQLQHTGGVVTIDLPGIGPVTQLGHTYELAHHDNEVPSPPPTDRRAHARACARHSTPHPTRRHAPAPAPRALIRARRRPRARLRHRDRRPVRRDDPRRPRGRRHQDRSRDRRHDRALGTPGDATWASSNRGKRSIAVDLKTAGGQEIVRRLIAGADVIHDNLRAGVAERLGFGYEQARAINPAIICSTSRPTAAPDRSRTGRAPTRPRRRCADSSTSRAPRPPAATRPGTASA